MRWTASGAGRAGWDAAQLLVSLASFCLTACGPIGEAGPTAPVASGAAFSGDPVVLVGAGDIACCDAAGARLTAQLLDSLPGIAFTTGDNVYVRGAREEYLALYEPTWGRHKGRTRPVVGNHDWMGCGQLVCAPFDGQGAGYFEYFGSAAGPKRLGYYGFDAGAWRVIVLNSSLPSHAGTPQYAWMIDELESSRGRCVLALFHYPLFSSGSHAVPYMINVWLALYGYGVDLVVNGHDHLYERFAPQDPMGRRDDTRGIRQITVGTGGAGLTPAGKPIANSEAVIGDAYGVLKLELRPGEYSWEFVPVRGKTSSDVGTSVCKD